MNAQVISFNCLLKNKAGRFISSTYNREVLNAVEAKANMLSGLSKGLQDLKKGELRKICVSAEEAYGLYDPAKVIFYPRKKLPQETSIGETISILGKSGTPRVYTVVKFHDEMVSLDSNHPLAGQDLVFEVEVLEARQATKSEIDDSINLVSKQLLN
jgi:FKBP-type peptidyl-prolyl cis-trans isomerase SlyD